MGWLWFLLGLMVGGSGGVVVMALMVVAHNADEAMQIDKDVQR